MVILGIIIGFVFIERSQQYLKRYEDLTIMSAVGGTKTTKGLLVLGVMTLHAFGEGSGVGVSFGGQSGWKQVYFPLINGFFY